MNPQNPASIRVFISLKFEVCNDFDNISNTKRMRVVINSTWKLKDNTSLNLYLKICSIVICDYLSVLQ